MCDNVQHYIPLYYICFFSPLFPSFVRKSFYLTLKILVSRTYVEIPCFQKQNGISPPNSSLQILQLELKKKERIKVLDSYTVLYICNISMNAPSLSLKETTVCLLYKKQAALDSIILIVTLDNSQLHRYLNSET